jgi:hypothetical protein
MNYQEAKKIREKSYISYLTEKLSEGQGVGSAIKATLSDKSKAKSKGFSEKFDVLNIAKFMTGGSKFAPALLGSMLGRTQQDIQYFSGTKKAKEVGGTRNLDIGQLESDNNVMDILSKIYTLLKTTNKNDTLRREKENNFKEEEQFEKERRHKALIEAITGKKQTSGTATPTATKADDGSGLLSTILGIVTGMISSAIEGVMSVVSGISNLIKGVLSAFSLGSLGPLKLLARLGSFLISPLGVGLLTLSAGAITAWAFWKMLKDPSGYEAADSATSQGLANAEKVGGLPGVKDEMDRRKKLPEYDRTMAEIQDYQFNYNESIPLNNVQLKGFAERGPGALEAVEDYKLERDRVQKFISERNQTATPVATPTSTSNETAAPTTNNQNTGPQLMNPSSDSTNKLNTVTSENLELNLPSTPESVVNSQIINNTNVNSTKGQKPKGPIPSVRNMEDSFQRMVFDSLRVV